VTSKVLRTSFAFDEAEQKKIKKAFDGCKALNDHRVRVAHGTWIINGGARHVSRQTFEVSEHFPEPADLRARTRECESLNSAVTEIVNKQKIVSKRKPLKGAELIEP
jgi:hypothetical protein